MPLLVVQSFVNTWEGDTGVDLLGDEPSAQSWLEAAELAGGSGTGGGPLDLAMMREVREAIRALLVANAGGAGPSNVDLGVLRRIAAASDLHVAVDEAGEVDVRPDGGHLEWGARLLLIIRDAQHDGSWKRLKACRNPDCLWAFYDRSHAGRGAWCDMAVCGNRIKNRNLRSRRAAAVPRDGRRDGER